MLYKFNSKIFSYLKDSLQQEDRTTEALYLLGVSYLWLGQYDNAIKVQILPS